MKTLKEVIKVVKDLGYKEKANYLEKTFTEKDFICGTNDYTERQKKLGPLDFFQWGFHGNYFSWSKLNSILLEREEQTSLNYKTEEIDYTGCHPVIAEALKNGKSIFCETPVGNISKIIAYDGSLYHAVNKRVFRFCEPIKKKKTETRVKSPVEIMQSLAENGYVINHKGTWRLHIDESRFGIDFFADMWQYCGKEPSKERTWSSEWLEEIET